MEHSDRTRPSLILRMRDRKDELSWAEFHERYGHTLYRYARARGGSHADAEDAVQDVEMQLFQAIDGFAYDGRKGRFRAYLRASIIHALARRAAKQARQPVGLDPQAFDYLAAEKEASQDELWLREIQLQGFRRTVHSIADSFDPTTRKAFEMHILVGIPVAETAKALEISIWSVYRARDRILKRLKEEMATRDPEDER